MSCNCKCNNPNDSGTLWLLKQILNVLKQFLLDIHDMQVAFPVALSGEDRDTEIELVTANGNVAAGAKYVNFIFSQDFTGTIGGVAFSGVTDLQVSFDAPPGDKLKQLDYTVTTGSIRIITIK